MLVGSPYRIPGEVEPNPPPKRAPFKVPRGLRVVLLSGLCGVLAYGVVHILRHLVCSPGAWEPCFESNCAAVPDGNNWPGMRQCSVDGFGWDGCDCEMCGQPPNAVRCSNAERCCFGECVSLGAPCVAAVPE